MVTRQKVSERKNIDRTRYGAATVTKREKLNETTGKYESAPINTSGDGYTATRDSTGAITGLKIGESFFRGLNNDQYQQLIKEHKNRPLSISEQATKKAGEDIEFSQAYEAEKNRLNPPQVTPEQLAEVGQTGELLPEEQSFIEQTSEDIKQNQKMKDIYTNPLGIPIGPGEFFGPQTLTSTGVKVLNRLVPGLGYEVLNGLTKNEAVKDFLVDYSNQENYDAIKKNLNKTDEDIAVAKELALVPGRQGEAIKLYNKALSKKLRLKELLTQIANEDQGAYVEKLKDDLTEIEDYFRNQKIVDDDDLNINLKTSKTYEVQ